VPEQNRKFKCRHVPTLKLFTESNNTPINEVVKFCVLNHHTSSKLHFENYFSDMDNENVDWIRNPTEAKVPDSILTTIKEVQITGIFSDTALKIKFSTLSLSEFFIFLQNAYKELSKKVMNILIPFTSYLYESGFSADAAIGSKHQSKVNVEREMKVAILTMKPRFKKLSNNKQAHPSN
jgi:hypothetical protein